MVYILTGVAKSGKSTIANKILTNHKISVFSTDDIMMMLHYNSLLPTLDITASDSSVAHIIEPYVDGLIRSLLEQQRDYVLEGVHFLTPFAKRLLEQYPNQVNILYLGYKDITTKQKYQELKQYENIIPNVWYSYMNDNEFIDLISYMIMESERIYQECVKYDIHYIDVYNLPAQTELIIDTLLQKKD